MKPEDLARETRQASQIFAHLSTEKKNRVLLELKRLLTEKKDYIIKIILIEEVKFFNVNVAPAFIIKILVPV